MINKRLLSLAAAGTLLLGLSSLAAAGIPDDTLSTAASGAGTVLVTPAGTGDTLGGNGLTISVHVADINNTAIAGYPFQDIWADDIGNGEVALCQGGSVADGNTDASGNTTISGAIAGGGHTELGMQVYLAGTPVIGGVTNGILAIDLNSPDITGDLVVNLADIGQFAGDFSLPPPGAFRSDFVADGIINLADVGQLGLHNGEVCP